METPSFIFLFCSTTLKPLRGNWPLTERLQSLKSKTVLKSVLFTSLITLLLGLKCKCSWCFCADLSSTGLQWLQWTSWDWVFLLVCFWFLFVLFPHCQMDQLWHLERQVVLCIRTVDAPGSTKTAVVAVVQHCTASVSATTPQDSRSSHLHDKMSYLSGSTKRSLLGKLSKISL